MIKVNVVIDGKKFEVDVTALPGPSGALSVTCDGQSIPVSLPGASQFEQLEWIIVNERPYEITVDPNLHWIKAFDGMHKVEIQDRSASFARPSSADGRVKAPIPGLITRVMVVKGDFVEAGQPMFLLEAMKMENEILAPRAGKVSDVVTSPGKSVTLHELLAEVV